MDRKKKNIAIVAGGDSSEYEISIGTAQNILHALDSEKYNANIVEIKKGEWKVWGQEGRRFDINRHDFSAQLNGSVYSFDGVINAIHGTPGENGILQAYFDLMGIPYTGCDSFCSSLTFNKYACNNFLAQLGITVAPSFLARANMKIDTGKIEKTVGFPCFIKPNNGGSSCGTSRVTTRAHSTRTSTTRSMARMTTSFRTMRGSVLMKPTFSAPS